MPPEPTENAPWLSIVLPTHLGGGWFKDTLDSLAAQSERGFECLIIDSSPDESTVEFARTYADRLNLRVFRRPDLEHWRSKTNFGFAQARARHVSMLHQDDFWLPVRAAALRAWLAADPDVAVHLHPSFIVDRNGRRLGTWHCPLPVDGKPAPRDVLIERLLVQNFISVPAPVIRRDAFLEVGGLDESLWYTADWDLYLKLARTGGFIYHPEVLSCFRIHGQSLTMSGSRRSFDFERQMRTVLETHIGALAGRRRRAVRSRALASIRVNTCLAAATAQASPLKNLLAAGAAILSLSPREIYEYLRESRLAERLLPRVRARFAGAL